MEPNTSFTVAAAASKSASALDGTNYPVWKAQMSAFLQSKGLGKFITPRAQVLMTQVADNPVLLEPLLEGDEKALGHIKCNIMTAYMEVVVNCTTALDAWNALANFFAGKESFNKIHLFEQLIEGHLIETGNPVNDIQKFIQEKNEIVRRLDSTGLKIDKELQVAIMLARLPQSYDVMRRIIESQPELTLEKFTAELNREAIRRSNKRPLSQEQAMFSNSRPPPTKKLKKDVRVCEFCDRAGHIAQSCWFNPDSKQFRPHFIKSAQRITELARQNEQMNG